MITSEGKEGGAQVRPEGGCYRGDQNAGQQQTGPPALLLQLGR